MLDLLLEKPDAPQTPMLANLLSFNETPQSRHKEILKNYDALSREAIAKDHRCGHGVYGANTYSGTLVTSFLEQGAITDLVNALAPLNAFSIASDLDPQKPLAAGIVKHLGSGESAQTNPTNFEPSGGSTVNALTITPVWYNGPMRVAAGDLNNGLRMDDLRQKAIATFSDTLIQNAMAPITAATFTATPLVRQPAAFNLGDLADLQGRLQKSPIKNLILDGTYKSRITNQPGYYQKTGNLAGSDGFKPYDWDGIYLNSNWAGAGANIKGFACNPQAIVRATGLPLSFPAQTLQTTTFELPGLNIFVAMSQWLSLATRTFFVSFDVVAGFTAADATAGIVIANGTPS